MRTDTEFHSLYYSTLSNCPRVHFLLCASWALWQQNTPMEFKQQREAAVTSQHWGRGRAGSEL